jgi:hypothetical protein
MLRSSPSSLKMWKRAHEPGHDEGAMPWEAEPSHAGRQHGLHQEPDASDVPWLLRGWRRGRGAAPAARQGPSRGTQRLGYFDFGRERQKPVQVKALRVPFREFAGQIEHSNASPLSLVLSASKVSPMGPRPQPHGTPPLPPRPLRLQGEPPSAWGPAEGWGDTCHLHSVCTDGGRANRLPTLSLTLSLTLTPCVCR